MHSFWRIQFRLFARHDLGHTQSRYQIVRLSASQHRLEFWLHGHVVIWVPFYVRLFDAWLLHRMAVQLTARCFDQTFYPVLLSIGLRFARPREYLLQLREL